jgi:hypothetical protein
LFASRSANFFDLTVVSTNVITTNQQWNNTAQAI